MAIYHCQLKPVSRGQGRSSTAAAAYRSCSKVYDERTGELHDYSRKRGLEHAEIVLSTEAAQKDIQWARDRQQLWNAAEAAERRKDARVGREYEVALPHELTKAQRVELTRSFSQDLANRYQCAVDFAIHKPHKEGDERNFHAHILATTRQVTPTGLGDKTYIEKSDTDRYKLGLGPGKDEVTTIRERWAEHVNRALEQAQCKERVNHRSLEAQGIERTPTRHLGPAISGLEARGEKSHVVERVREQEANRRLEKAAEIGQLGRESVGLEKSIIDLSGNIEHAKRERDLTLAKGAEIQKAARPTVDELQRQARDQWLAMRAAEKAKSPQSAKEQTRENAPDKGRSLTVDELRQKAIAEWREYRKESLDKTRTPEKSPERDQGLEKTLEKTLGRSGADNREPRDKGPEQTPDRNPGKSRGRDGPEYE